MDREIWISLAIMIAVIAGVMYGLPRLVAPNQNKWDTIIARCHDVEGRDYDGCLNRENMEWNRGGRP